MNFAGLQGRLNAVLLCLRYVNENAVAFGGQLVPSLCTQQKKSRFKNEKLRGCLCSSEAIIWVAELMIQLALTVSLLEEHFPSSHVHLAVGTPQCHDLD